MYYKQHKGELLIHKSTEMPKWVKWINEEIKAQFDNSKKDFLKNSGNEDIYKTMDDISDYMV